MAYQLASPIPSIVNRGMVTQGVDTSGARIMWKDGSNVRHMLAAFGHAIWYANYCNLGTGDATLITGGNGATWSAAYHPSENKLYVGSVYQPASLTEFDPTGPTATVLKDDFITAYITIIGDDGKVYVMDGGYDCWSLDPSDNSWHNFGSPGTAYDNAAHMGGGNGYLWVGLNASEEGNSPHQLWCISTTSGDWAAPTGWTFNSSGDKEVAIYVNAAGTGWFAYRKLSDDTAKYYSLNNDGSVTEISNPGMQPANGKPWNCYIQGDPENYSYFNDFYQTQVNFDDLFPIKTIHEYTKFGYNVSNGGWNFTPELPFTTGWVTKMIKAVVPLTGTHVLGLTFEPNATIDLDYTAAHDAEPNYLGATIISPYGAMKHSSGEIYAAGYSNRIWRYDPVPLNAASWTLTNSNATLVEDPADATTNPFEIYTEAAPILHYRNHMDYDANGLVWVVGNIASRLGSPYGDIMWYNPTDGTHGYMFPQGATPTWYQLYTAADVCAANNRTLICASNDQGEIYIITATGKSLDATPIVPGTTGRWYMIEAANNLVVAVLIYGSGNKICSFNPTTKSVITGPQDLGVAGTPFGWSSSEANRLNYKLELGPDGYVWMVVGTTIYRINPSTLAFSSVVDPGAAYQIKFAANNTDLVLYANGTDFYYYPGMLQDDGMRRIYLGGLQCNLTVS